MAKSIESISPTEFRSPDQLPPEKKWQFKPLFLVLAFLVVAILFVLYFLLTAKAVLFEVNADNPQVQISGGLSIPFGNSTLLLKRDYDIEVRAEGYEVYQDILSVTSDTPPQIAYELTPLPGNLAILVIGDEDILASAVLTGETLAEPRSIDSSLSLLFEDIPAGIYQLSVDADLYKEAVIDVEVPGRNLTHEINVELEPNWGWASIEYDPSNASLYVDGTEKSEAEEDTLNETNPPVRVRVEAGQHQLQVLLDGYKPFTKQIDIEKDEEIDLGAIQLEHVDSQIGVLTNPEGVTVLVNQEYAGETPIVLDLLPDREHRIDLFKSGFQPKTETIRVERNTETDYNFTLSPDLVQVSVSVHPENADLKIDGRSIQLTGNQISLPTVKHDIEVSAPGYQAKSVEFLPTRGTRQHLQVRLLTTEQALWANIPANYATVAKQDMKLFRDAGEITMGSSRGEPDRRANETSWQADLKRPFYISLTEVTNSQYKLYESEHTSGHFEGNSLDSPNQPVVNISWQQAALYCNWLSEKEGLTPFYKTERGFVSGTNSSSTGYRLLTEAEWTWLVRSTSTEFPQKYIWGDADTPPNAVENYADQSVSELINFTLDDINDSYITSAPVRSFSANSKGVYDLSGNVNEWMHDWYAPSAYDPNQTIADPLGPEQGEFHVIRGASWARGHLPQLRLAYRDYDSTGRNDLGFRIARYAM